MRAVVAALVLLLGACQRDAPHNATAPVPAKSQPAVTPEEFTPDNGATKPR